jgi:SNF2 family DNA or RNA helicase
MELAVPTIGGKVLHKHQTTAIWWMMEREEDCAAPGGLICDEMGLGKTLTTIGLILNSPVKKTLILGPLAVLRQWVIQLTSCGSSAPAIYELKKTTWMLIGGNTKYGQVYITNYDKLLYVPHAFSKHYNRIICDEAHTLRNSKGKKYIQLRSLSADSFWCLTGTPIVNSYMDLAALVALFKRTVNPKLTPREETAMGWMADYALARSATQLRSLGIGIPKPAEVFEHRLPFKSEEEATFYRGIQGIIGAQLDRLMEQDHTDMIMVLLLLMRLRQISVHPQIYINAKKRGNKSYSRPDFVGDSTKTAKILDILNADQGSHGYVIFCNFKDEIDLLEERLKKEGCVANIYTYHGEMSAEQRHAVVTNSESDCVKAAAYQNKGCAVDATLQAAFPKAKLLPLDCCGLIQDFIGPRHTVILAQIQCAGTGLNLQYMDRVIFTTPWWTAALMDQAAGRVLRLGQTRQVQIHYVRLEEEEDSSINIDDYMNARVEQKRELCQQLISAANHDI